MSTVSVTLAPMPQKNAPKKETIGARIDPELITALEALAAEQEYPPTLSLLVEHAIREFLEKRGKLPIASRPPRRK